MDLNKQNGFDLTPIHFDHITRDHVQEENAGGKFRLESDHRQDSLQETMVHPIQGLGLIQNDQRAISVDFFYDRANQVKVILDRPTIYSTSLFR